MVRLVWRTDLHLSDTSPLSRVDCWSDTMLEKLQQVGDIATEVNAHAVIDGGDFFHIKSPSRTSHALIQQVTEVHAKYPCPVYCCVGNHDCVYGNYEYLPQQPLGVLFSTGVFKRLYDEYEALFTSEDTTVRVVGVPYHGTSYDLERFRSIKKGSEDFLVVVGHVLASQKGGSMFEGEDILSYSKIQSFEGDVFCFGHWHKDQGITKVVGDDGTDKYIVNVGSMSRGSLSQDHMDRSPCAVVMSFSGSEFINLNRRDLKVKPSSEVFDIEGRVRADLRQVSITEFVERMDTVFSEYAKTPIEDLIRELPDIPPQVREEALLIWESSKVES